MINVYHGKLSDAWCATAIEDEKILATAWASTERDCLQEVIGTLPYNQPFTLEQGPSPLAQKVLSAINSVVTGENLVSQFSLQWRYLSKYAQKVLSCLAKVPVGYVTTYKELARTAGGGPRAVGQIMALNPFAPLVPCHRVIKADFSIGGFGGSRHDTQTKRSLLQRENRGFEKPSKIKTECGVLELYPVGFLRRG